MTLEEKINEVMGKSCDRGWGPSPVEVWSCYPYVCDSRRELKVNKLIEDAHPNERTFSPSKYIREYKDDT